VGAQTLLSYQSNHYVSYVTIITKSTDKKY